MIKFVDTEKKLSLTEAKYWRKVFNSNLMIGTEIEQMFEDYRIETTEVRRFLAPLRPGGSPEQFTSPVSSIKSDGSLRGGAEIITPGRKVYGFMEQFSMFQSIYNCLKDNDPIISPRCGWHNHIVLQDYGAKALERHSIPRVIFDNFMLLLQHYYPALAFMTATIPEDDCYTRYAYFNKTEGLKSYTHENSLDTIKRIFNDRYNAINIRPMDCNVDSLANFHVEFRFPDGTLFPIQMAALNILFKSIVIKAIELSKFGIVKFDYDTDRLYKFKNNGNPYDEEDYDYDDGDFENEFDEDDRRSAKVTDEIIDEIKILAMELVNLLEPEIISIDKLALPFIKNLAVFPVTLMFKDLGTDDLRAVNDALEEMLDTEYKKINEQAMPLVEIIEIGAIRNVETPEEWYDKASELVSFKEPLENLIEQIKEVVDLGFNKNLGFYFK